MQLANARMAHFTKRLGFNLVNAFARDFELFADFLQGASVTIHEAKTLFENFSFPFVQAAENIAQFVFQQTEARHFRRIFGEDFQTR